MFEEGSRFLHVALTVVVFVIVCFWASSSAEATGTTFSFGVSTTVTIDGVRVPVSIDASGTLDSDSYEIVNPTLSVSVDGISVLNTSDVLWNLESLGDASKAFMFDLGYSLGVTATWDQYHDGLMFFDINLKLAWFRDTSMWAGVKLEIVNEVMFDDKLVLPVLPYGRKRADVNGDSVVNDVDAEDIFDGSIPNTYHAAADTNFDGLINSVDAAKVYDLVDCGGNDDKLIGRDEATHALNDYLFGNALSDQLILYIIDLYASGTPVG